MGVLENVRQNKPQYNPSFKPLTMPEPHRFSCQIPPDYAGQRFDQALAELLPAHSRARLQQWIKDGCIQLDGQTVKPRVTVQGGEQVTGEWTPEPVLSDQPQAIPFDLRYEDADLLIINKPAGLVVHPAAGNPDGTLVNALLHFDASLATLPRAGIVHRLDKDTSGLMVVARSLRAHTALVEQLQARSVSREYLAVVNGVMTAGGKVDAPIGRHPVDRKRMAVVENGRHAVTHYRVQQRFRAHTLLDVQLETGRTHQIRVHLAHIRYPLLGDPVYGGRLRLTAGMSAAARDGIQAFRRQALHAARLALTHPVSGERLEWRAEPPADFNQLLALLHTDHG